MNHLVTATPQKSPAWGGRAMLKLTTIEATLLPIFSEAGSIGRGRRTCRSAEDGVGQDRRGEITTGGDTGWRKRKGRTLREKVLQKGSRSPTPSQRPTFTEKMFSI